MHRIRYSLGVLALLLVALAGCTPDTPEQTALDVTRPGAPGPVADYVALGGSLTAGFLDGGLIASGQSFSYPLQIAQRLGYTNPAAVPGGALPFYQPLVAGPGIGRTTLADPDYVAGVLYYDAATGAVAVLDSTARAELPSLLLAASLPVPYHNLAVPGATSFDLNETLNSEDSTPPGNAFFDFILRNPAFGQTDMVRQAIGKGPFLVTLWVGYADILGPAMSGRPGPPTLPPSGGFVQAMEAAIDRLDSEVHDRFGYAPALIVGNIPSPLDTPYFVPRALYDMLGGQTALDPEISFVLFPYLTELLAGADLDANEIDVRTLTATEAQAVRDKVDEYNARVEELRVIYDFLVADVHTHLATLTDQQRLHLSLLMAIYQLDGPTAAATTRYSLDGIHPNPAGYALIGNVFLDEINTALGLEGEAALDPLPEDLPWDPTYGHGWQSGLFGDGPPARLTPAARAALTGLAP